MKLGVYPLLSQAGGDFQITTAGEQIGAALAGLDGNAEFDCDIRFQYGSGGTDAKAFLQTSLDQGATWIDLWCFRATTAAKHQVRRLAPVADVVWNPITPSDGALAADTLAAAIVFGDRLRVKVVSTGTYADSTVLSVRVTLR